MCGIWFFLKKNNNINSVHNIKLHNSINIIDNAKLYNSFNMIRHRGPDNSRYLELYDPVEMKMGFHRLSIMDLSHNGDQPFIRTEKDRTIYLLCNGEIYIYESLISIYDLDMHSSSDCEVIIELYLKYGMNKVIDNLVGEFAFIIIDITKDSVNIFSSRDTCGVRPLFYANNDDFLMFSSEIKGIVDITEDVKIIEPNSVFSFEKSDNFSTKYKKNFNFNEIKSFNNYDLNQIHSDISFLLHKSVVERLHSDRPFGALLSGGLDSSLVCALAARHLNTTLQTFSVGIKCDFESSDEKYAKLVAKHINSNHTHVSLPIKEWIDAIDEVIYTTETYDITTIRASVGQFLISKWIKENTNIKVLLIGDGSDELCGGYMYFHNSPNETETHNENINLLNQIHMYDVLRADRCISYHGLEARVPFLDKKFINYYLSIPHKFRHINKQDITMEKFLLRDAFSKLDLIPNEVLWRRKEAFSDGVSNNDNSWHNILQKHFDKLISDEYNSDLPSKEAQYYIQKYENYFGKINKNIIPKYWLPKWCGDVKDPSARVLNIYDIHKK